MTFVSFHNAHPLIFSFDANIPDHYNFIPLHLVKCNIIFGNIYARSQNVIFYANPINKVLIQLRMDKLSDHIPSVTESLVTWGPC